jgi:Zn-finger nucleic acid-binding protein
MDTKKSINCPACGNLLTKIKVGRVFIDVCEGACGGIWFDQFELANLNQPTEKKGEKLLNIRRNPNISVDKNAKHICPVCNVEMYNYSITMGRAFVTDECPECGGFWLDGGEFAMLRNDSGFADINAFDVVAAKSQYRASHQGFLVKLFNLLTFS